MLNIDDMIKEIVGEEYEFWHRDAEDTLRKAITDMLVHNVPPRTIVSVLSSVWHASAGEYGA